MSSRQEDRGKAESVLTFNTAIDSFMNSASVRFADELTEQHITRWYGAALRKQGNSPRIDCQQAPIRVCLPPVARHRHQEAWRRRDQHSRRRSVEIYSRDEMTAFFGSLSDRPVSPHWCSRSCLRPGCGCKKQCSCAGPTSTCRKASSGSSSGDEDGRENQGQGGARCSGSGGPAGKTQAMERATRQHQARAWHSQRHSELEVARPAQAAGEEGGTELRPLRGLRRERSMRALVLAQI